MSQDWRNNEPRIRTREETPPTPQPAQTKKALGVGEFAIFFVLAMMCSAVVAYTCFKQPLLKNVGAAPASDNCVTMSDHQQPRFTVEDLEKWYGNWDVDSWNDDLNAVEISTYGWLDSGKELGHKEATVCIVPEDYRALKAIALMKNMVMVSYICRGVHDERAKK